MTTVSAGSSTTLTASTKGATFVVTAQGGAIGSVTGAESAAIGPLQTCRAFGPYDIGQSITVSMQIGQAVIEFGDADPGAGSAAGPVMVDPGVGAMTGPDGSPVSGGGSDALRRAITRHGGIYSPALMASPPTITVGAVYAGTTIASPQDKGYLANAFVTPASLPGYFNYNGKNYYGPGGTTLHFYHDGPSFGIQGRAGDSYLIFARSPDKAVFETASAKVSVPYVGGYSVVMTDVVFSARARREIFIMMQTNGFAGLYIGPSDTIEPASQRCTALMMTDSYGGLAGVSGQSFGPLGEMAMQCGIDVGFVDAQGGSGYSTNGSGKKLSDPTRVALAKTRMPTVDFIFTDAGINDGTTTLYADVVAYIGLLRSSWGTTTTNIYGAVWCPSSANIASAQSKRDLILQAIQSAETGPWGFVDNLAGAWRMSDGRNGLVGNTPWQTGVPLSSGNGSLYFDAGDVTHPNPAGVTYLGAVKAASLAAIAGL